jgi:cardiolipin synthase
MLAWIFGAIAVVIALALFVFYMRGTFRGRYCYQFANTPAASDPRFLRVLPGVSDSIDAPGRVTGFYGTPSEIYRARLDAIALAARCIDLETYYMTPGRRADDLADALVAKARAGVRVRFIPDAQGVMMMPRAYWERLRANGVEVRFYNTFEWFAPGEYLSRTHRKLLIVDGKAAMVGGTGFSDEWDGKAHDEAPWADVEVKLEGAAVDRLSGTFLRQWAAVGGAFDFADHGAEPAEGDGLVLVTTGQYSSGVSPLGVLYQTCIAAAREKLWVASPYFLPDTTTRQALVAAARRGVDVRIVTMGKRNDRVMVYHASRELYGELLAAGARIYEYQPSLMHAKALLVDDAWATVGSANFDPMSFFANAELNVSAGQPALLGPLNRWFHGRMAESHEVTSREWATRPWWVWAHGKFWLRFRRVL